jgi:glycosyltransferase involved in cell wall biosynthesis
VASEWQNWLPATKTKIVRNWVNQKFIPEHDSRKSEFKADTSRFNITMMASVIPWKRQMDAVRAVANLIGESLNVALLIIGPILNEKYRDDIIAFIKENKLQERVRLLGYVENPERIVKSSQAAVVCSHLEPFGRGTVETMMCGVPVVGANSGGTVEIIEDEVSGLLYPVGDIAALANQLRRLVKNEDFRQILGKNAIKRAEQFSSAEKEMGPLIDLLSTIRGAPNPSWPLGEILGDQTSAELKNPERLNGRELGKLLFRKLKCRIRRLIFRKSN